MTIRKGARNSRGDLSAINWRNHDPEVSVDHGQIKSRKMKQLDYAWIAQQGAESRRVVGAGRELNQMSISVTGGELNDAKPVTIWVQSHRFGVDRDHRSEIDPPGEIALMQPICHLALRRRARPLVVGAQEKTRTSTSYRPLEPESSASTNSATWARQGQRK